MPYQPSSRPADAAPGSAPDIRQPRCWQADSAAQRGCAARARRFAISSWRSHPSSRRLRRPICRAGGSSSRPKATAAPGFGGQRPARAGAGRRGRDLTTPPARRDRRSPTARSRGHRRQRCRRRGSGSRHGKRSDGAGRWPDAAAAGLPGSDAAGVRVGYRATRPAGGDATDEPRSPSEPGTRCGWWRASRHT
jgi:hypothetical protein